MDKYEVLKRISDVTGQEFSEEQNSILLQEYGMCIIACAGSGKTSVVTSLIAKRILTGELDPTKLVATTFSVDGAGEMDARLDILLQKMGIGWASKYTKIKTIHALCKEILDTYNVPTSVVNGLDKYKMLSNAIADAGLKLEHEDIETLGNMFGYQINKMLTDHQVVTSAEYTLDEVDEQAYTAVRVNYSLAKKAYNVIDFDDMLYKTYWLLCKADRPDIVAYFRNKWEYFFIDEAQDMSAIQYEIMKALISNPNKAIFVGDDDQSIYKWRGSSPDILLNVSVDLGIKKMLLSTNYRCKEKIVKFAELGISNNTIREPKEMKAHQKGGVVVLKATKGRGLLANTITVANAIKDIKASGERLDDICVLCRYNQDLSLLNGLLFTEGMYCNIPNEAKMINGKLFKDIKGVVDLVTDDWFMSSSTIVLNGWKLITYLSKANAKMLGNCMKNNNISFKELLALISSGSNSSCEMAKLDNVSQAGIYDFTNRVSFDTMNDIKKLNKILNGKGTNEEKAIGILAHYSNKAHWRFKGVRSGLLLDGYIDFAKLLITEKGYVETKSLLANMYQYEKGLIASMGAKVELSTCHRAKGKEWKYVIILGDDNNSFPSLEKLNKAIEKGVSRKEVIEWIQEERRLHYVAKTRAKEKLLLVSNLDDLSVFTAECLGVEFGDSEIIRIASCGEDMNKEYKKDEWVAHEEKEIELSK